MFWDTFSAVLFLFAGIGVFLVGVIMFSNVLQSGNKERIAGLFVKMGNNRMVGFGLGTAATTVIQSSTATTVIVVGLVNAGVMTLAQSTAVIFGANVGTALSNMLLSLADLPVRYFFMSLVGIGAFIKVFSKKKRANKIADIMIAFGIIFVGLQIMRMAFSPTTYGGQHLTSAFENMIAAINFPILLLLVGFLITAIIQSSTAAAAIFITLASQGIIDFSEIMYLVIGTLLGTTLTTLIASIPANKNAKRAAIIHLLFSVIATLVFLPILWPLESVFVPFFENLIPDPVWQISVFSLFIKLSTAIILLPLIKPINRLTYKIIPDKKPKPLPSDADEIIEQSPRKKEQLQGFTEEF